MTAKHPASSAGASPSSSTTHTPGPWPDLLTAAKNFVEAFGAGEFDDPFKVVSYVDRFNAAIARAEAKEIAS